MAMTEKRTAYKNFDEFLHEPEEIRFTYGGREWVLPGAVPMVKLFEIYELQQDLGDELATMKKVCTMLMGEKFEEFEKTVHAPHAIEIMTWLMDQIMSRVNDEMPDEEASEGKVQGLQAKLRSARSNISSSGTNLRQTSGGFTLSPIENSAI